MYACTNRLSLLTFNSIIYTNVQHSTMLPFLIFYRVNRFRELRLFFLIFHYNNVKVAKNRQRDLTVLSTQMKSASE